MPREHEPTKDGMVSPQQWFVTTHWSVVLSAKNGSGEQANVALNRQCDTYWVTMYALVRRCGHEPHDERVLVQECVARLLARDFLRAVDRSKGKFRSFLLAALDHFLANEWRRAKAQKRGGKFSFVSINDETAEQPYLQVASTDQSPEKVFERQWAMTFFSQVLARLRAEYVASGKQALFGELKVFLTGEKHSARYNDLAAKFNTTEDALKMAVSRLRRRYGELLRAEIANTVSCPHEVDEELRALFAALSS